MLLMIHSVSLYCDYAVDSKMQDAERMKEESVLCMKMEVWGEKPGLYSN